MSWNKTKKHLPVVAKNVGVFRATRDKSIVSVLLLLVLRALLHELLSLLGTGFHLLAQFLVLLSQLGYQVMSFFKLLFQLCILFLQEHHLFKGLSSVEMKHTMDVRLTLSESNC